jgi:hypothetical protein
VLGSPGSGKSYFVIRRVITQHIAKGFTMFVYDFKFDDLSRIAYNTYLKLKTSYPVAPEFYVINFDDLSRSHRCNPLGQASMVDITDANDFLCRHAYHVHCILFFPDGNYDLSKIIANGKRFIAYEIVRRLEQKGCNNILMQLKEGVSEKQPGKGTTSQSV